MTYSFLEPARNELEEAIAHYESEKQGLGDEFAHEIGKTIQRILSHPGAWTMLSKTVRCCRLKRFPYGIVYAVQEDEIRILAVMHLHRRPGYWKSRQRKKRS